MVKIDESIQKKVVVEKVLKSFKNKSSGTDKLKTEDLKYNKSKYLVTAILVLLTMIWPMVVAVWLHANVTCIFKKGSRKLVANYGGLSQLELI